MPEQTTTPDPNTDPIGYRADKFRTFIKEQSGVDFDYSMFALLHLDTIFGQMVSQNLQNIQKPEFEQHRKSLTLDR